MKSALLFVTASLLAISVRAESAYEALRSFGSARGQGQLNHVIEVQGRNGGPQPRSWKILLDDASARGGVREVEIRKGEIISERTPVREYTGAGATAAMDFKKLNLDSEGAFKIADSEARKARVGFDKVDYTLRIGDQNAAPIWVMELLNSEGRKIRTVRVSADTGAIVRERGIAAPRQGRETDEDFVPDRRTPRERESRSRHDDIAQERDPERENTRGRDYVEEDEPDYDSNRRGVKYHIKKVFVGAGASLEEFITGKRTIDRNYRD